MSSPHRDSLQISKAEADYREAFVRLQKGKPRILKKGAKVTQNNVAKEAGKDPSALKKDRYPALIRDIQAFKRDDTQSAPPSRRQLLLAAQRKNKKLKIEIELLTVQRDRALSELLSAKTELHEMWLKIQRLESKEKSSVVPMRRR